MEKSQTKTSRVVLAVARVTFLETVRDKVLYNVILVAFLLFGVGFLASRLSEMSPERVVLDFGLSALSISCLLVSVLAGAGLLGKELERRTIHVALSHPISRMQFLIGKYLGLMALLAVNWFLMCLVYFGLIAVQSENFVFHSVWLVAAVLVLVQTCVIGAVAIFFSTFTTTSLSVILTLGVYLIGVNNKEMTLLATRVKSVPGKAVLQTMAGFLPNLEHFNLGAQVTYALPVAPAFALTGVLYGILVSVLFVFLGGLLLRLREI